jgi:lysophospholipase L1-like esterase
VNHPLRWLLPLLALAALGTTCQLPANEQVYVALGDSLSAGVGASRADATAFVPLVHDELPAGTSLLNLGHSGDTSAQLIDHGHLDKAVLTIESRNEDATSANDVSLVTLEIGGNDLLGIYFSLVLTGVCPDLETSLATPRCVDTLQSVLDGFEPNLEETLDALYDADPGLRVVVLTLYDPFSGLLDTYSELAALSLEGMPGTPFESGLNDIIRAQAEAHGADVAEVYPLFEGRAPELISGDFIHPNDAGYAVMADAVREALTR